MNNGIKPVPDGFHTITPSLVVKGAAAAIDFYKKAFGAVELGRSPTPDGRLMHAELKIGNSNLFLADEFPEMESALAPQASVSPPTSLHLYVDNADSIFGQAVAAGAKVTMPLMDMFWGDRFGKLTDPFGHTWSIGTHIEDVSHDEMQRRASAFRRKAHITYHLLHRLG